MAIVHSVQTVPEKVDDPLIAEEVGVGLARSPQLGDRVFIGVQFKGKEGVEDAHGHVVLTVEMAEHVARLILKAVGKAKVEEGEEAGEEEI